MRVLTQIEQKTLCIYLNENLDPCNIGILICLFTGLRIDEVCALCWEDISFTDKVINIRHTLQRVQDKTGSEKRAKIVVTTPKSTCSIKTIPLPDSLVNTLEKDKTVSEGYALTNITSVFIESRTMQNHFNRILYECGIENLIFIQFATPWRHVVWN